MPELISVAYYSQDYAPDGRIVVEVSAESEMSFAEALAQALGHDIANRPNYALLGGATEAVQPPWFGGISDDVLVAHMAAFAAGETLRIDSAGRGGWLLPDVWDLLESALTMADVVALGVGTYKVTGYFRTRRVRGLLKDWYDAGMETDPPLSLRQAVYIEPEWKRRDFDREFKLGPVAGPALLRRLGYEKVNTAPERWKHLGEE